jgi:hypothetical protein
MLTDMTIPADRNVIQNEAEKKLQDELELEDLERGNSCKYLATEQSE